MKVLAGRAAGKYVVLCYDSLPMTALRDLPGFLLTFEREEIEQGQPADGYAIDPPRNTL